MTDHLHDKCALISCQSYVHVPVKMTSGVSSSDTVSFLTIFPFDLQLCVVAVLHCYHVLL